MKLFSEIKIRELKIKNRIFVSPMCQYSCTLGQANNWHLVHLGARAIGGAGLVMAEASAVSPEGRITKGDLGLWNEEQMKALQPVTQFILEQGATPAIQLAHAGRKASSPPPWKSQSDKDSTNDDPAQWTTLGPSAVTFSADYSTPREMQTADLEKVLTDFKKSTVLARKAGFQVVEVHMAHGYLLHEFLSPFSNIRTDQYGGSLENRMRFPLQVAQAVRELWPQEWPVFVRISATDWTAGGWDLEQSLVLCRELKKIGIDLIDCSTGGNIPDAKIPVGPGYQVEFATAIKNNASILTGAVGMITEPQQAAEILEGNQADVIFLARELLRDPQWPLRAAAVLKQEIKWPSQYERAHFRLK